MDEPKSAGKPFAISKQAVVEAFRKVQANKGGPGLTDARSRTSNRTCGASCM